MDLIIFVVALSILVLVHEFGHFFAAKITGVKVEEFGLGLPPRIIGKKWKGTIWSLNWLPIGGFCKLFGEDVTDETVVNKKDSFLSKNPWQKALIVLGGVLMNMVLAITIFTVVYGIMGVPKEVDRVMVIGVAKNSPAEKAGIKEDEVINSINGMEIKKGQELIDEANKNKGKKVKMMVNQREVEIEIREKPPEGEGSMGVVISNTVMEKIKWYEFNKSIGAGFKEAFYWGKIIFEGVTKMITGVFTGKMPKDVAGPIGMYQATTSIKQNQGMLALIHFFGIVSVNLAVVNVLPFPALDGGRIIFVIYEFIFRKRVNQKFETVVNNLGMYFLLTMTLLITVGDLLRVLGR